MKSADNIRELIKKLRIRPGANMDRKVHDGISQALEEWEQTKPVLTEHNIGRIIMKSQITKFAAAAAIIIVAAISITFLDKAVTPAYAIEQTIEASRNIKYLHFMYSGSSDNIPAKEAWLEYDERGQIKNVRVNWYYMKGGDMVMVWKEGKTQMWLKKSKILKFFEDEIYTAKILFFVQSYDPTRAVEHIYELQKKGDVEIVIEEPSNGTDPIVITATFLPNTFLLEGQMPQMREIFFVDQTTKLVTAIEIYELKDGEYIDRGVWSYPDYDKLFEAGVFDLEKEVPADVKHLDLMKLDVGLEQTTLTKEEIAFKVVREFFEAWIAKDYERAVKIHGYHNPDQKPGIQKKLEKLNIIRIISIGEPFPPPPDRSKGCLGVPCITEVEKNGEIFEWQVDLFVGRVMGHPNRWSINKFKLP